MQRGDRQSDVRIKASRCQVGDCEFHHSVVVELNLPVLFT